MELRSVLHQGLAQGLRLGRGTADQALRLTRRVLERRRTVPRAPASFTPSPTPPERKPSPASVARNIAPQRPAAKPVPGGRTARKPASVPGAKLPPRHT